MSQRLREEVLFMGALLVVVVTALITAADYPFRARLMPQVVAGAILVLLVVELLLTLRRQRRAAEPPGEPIVGGKGRRMLPFLAWLVGLYAAIALLGLLPAAALFTLAFSRAVGRMSWGAALLGAVILTGAVFGLGRSSTWIGRKAISWRITLGRRRCYGRRRVRHRRPTKALPASASARLEPASDERHRSS